ncbi:hypothetical protein KKI24_15905 [bacterium]|nr:hypothetical protein [bacterium]
MKKKVDALPEWKRHYLENLNKSLETKKQEQQRFLVDILLELKSLFGPLLMSALKKVEKEKLSEEEMTSLMEHEEASELQSRIKGLKRVFGNKYYTAVDAVMGENTFKKRTLLSDAKQDEDGEEEQEVMSQSVAKLPKGFSKWDLKQVKLHESFPDKAQNDWVEFFSLKGETAVGRILYNEAKDLLYFRPYDVNTAPIFPLTEDQGRKLTREGRSYYFKKTTPPPGEI